MTRTNRIRRFAVVVALLLAGVATLSTSSPASGQSPIDDKREEARQVAARLDELTARYARLSDRANEAETELAEVEERIGQAEARLAATVAERDQTRTQLQDYAVDAYLEGPDNSTLSVAVDSRDEREMPVRLGYIDSVTGNRTQLIEQLAATEEDVNDRVAELEENRQAAADLVEEIEQSAADAQQAIDEQEQLQSQIDAEIAGLIEEQRAAEAAARQAEIDAAAAQAAAAQPTAPSGGDTGGDPSGGGSTGGGSSPTPPPPAAGAAGAVAAAMSMQGVPYRWGGADPSGFDCSGLMMWAWGRAGRSLPHSSAAQYGVTRRISAADLQPGDLVFYGSPIHHVAMYIGGGQIVDALNSGTPVGVRSIGYPGSVSGYGRP
ncbi:MAG TPA: NlpC/P60 family protein [Acidimicrobiales bacterium]|nr:NlpC/P60 family protein [Acidimicrobiales bacterium]